MLFLFNTVAGYQQTGSCFERAVMGKTLTQPEREDFLESSDFLQFCSKMFTKKRGGSVLPSPKMI